MTVIDRKTEEAIAETVVHLAASLVRRKSVTPADAGCQELIAGRLAKAGFHCEPMPFGDVANLWARYGGDRRPLICFAGHTDVVPAGDLQAWDSEPFAAVRRDGKLFGRGAADMKGGLAAMIVAAEQFVTANPDFAGSLAFLITSDEEGLAVDGTRKVVQALDERNETIDWCIVGEPSSNNSIGDTIRIGRRGSLNGRLVINGRSGHVAYPEQIDNPVRRASPFLNALLAIQWDSGNEHFPPTGFEIVTLNSGGIAANVTPPKLEVVFNFRYSTEWHHEALMRRVEALLAEFDIDEKVEWELSGEPFLTQPGKLIETVQTAIKAVTGSTPILSTSGGTSDGRFLAPRGIDVVELGPVNATIHQPNECVSEQDLTTLCRIYGRVLEQIFDAT